MGRDNRHAALAYLLSQADKQGYVTFDNIIDCADSNSLPIKDFDWLASEITTRGVLVYDTEPESQHTIDSKDDDFDDFSQIDYTVVFDRIIEIDDSMEDFVEKVRNIKPPQWKELASLEYQVIEGNRHARNRMIEMHLRLALKMALQRAEQYDMDMSEAISEACIGLILAVDKYDPDTNGAFSSYATMWILQNISRYQSARNAVLYYPVHRKDLYFTAYPILKEIGYTDTPDLFKRREIENLLRNQLDFDEKQIEDVLNAAIPPESLDEILSEDTQKLLDHAVERKVAQVTEALTADDDTEQSAFEMLRKEDLEKALGELRPREKDVLMLHYGLIDDEEKTLEEVGKRFGVTRERIRQIETKALYKLSHRSQFKKLREYFD